MRDPFYTDQYEQEHIKPPVIRLMLSSELYCRVCGLILKGDQAASLQSHQSVIQSLSRKGIYVMEGDDMPVTEGDLMCQPIKMVSLIYLHCLTSFFFFLSVADAVRKNGLYFLQKGFTCGVLYNRMC